MKTDNKIKRSSLSPEFGVDSRYKNKSDKLEDGKRLLEARLERLNRVSRSEIVKARLLQLKIQMEEYLKQPDYGKEYNFTNFLTKYIDAIYQKRVQFAKDLGITAVSLSHVINNHREPKEEFMYRLMLHSEMTYKNISDFRKRMWYQVYYHEKICETMASQKKWKSREKRYVKIENAVLN